MENILPQPGNSVNRFLTSTQITVKYHSLAKLTHSPINPTLQKYAETVSQIDAVVPPDKRQFELTETILTPEMEAIMAELMMIRRYVDEEAKEAMRKAPRHKPQNGNNPASTDGTLEKYPIGYCDWIRDRVFEIMNASSLRTPQFIGIKALRKFTQRGGILKPVKGIQHKQFFQNGIQAGAYWVDVANDTVDPSKPKVVHSWMAESGFENVDDPTLCAEVIESYWKHDVYPNIYFPELATLFPFFHTDSNGEVTIAPSPEPLIGTAILSDLRTTENFLFSSRFSDRRLPREYTDLIGKHFHFTEEEPSRSFHRTGVSHEELAEVFAQHREGLGDGSFRETMLSAHKTVDDFNSLELKPRDRITKKLQGRY